MNTAAKVTNIINEIKNEGYSKSASVVRIANACLGWAYVFGARGEYCNPANRRRFYNTKKKPTIKSKCKNFEGSGSCSGCEWYPGGVTRFFDCRGFTYWVLLQVGIKIMGAGATSQYNDDSNWAEKGPIEKMPKDKVCCVFRHDSSKNTMEHTLLYDGDGHYIHDNGIVRKVSVSQYKATHYAIPKGLYDESDVNPQPQPEPEPVTPVKTHLTLRKGSKGAEVKEMQKLLIKAGYKLPKYGADGDFGNETLAAVKAFQKNKGLTVDGIVGPKTWAKLDP